MDVAPGPVSLATRETPATQGLLIIVAAFWLATLACGGADFTPALVRLGAQVRHETPDLEDVYLHLVG